MGKRLVRTNHLNIRLSDPEYSLITGAAGVAGVSPSEFMRNAAKEKATLVSLAEDVRPDKVS